MPPDRRAAIAAMLRFNKRQPRNSRIRKNVEEQAIYRNPIACGKRSGLAGLGNALRTVAALLLMCDPRDLGVAFSEEPNLYLYDCYPGGVGQSAPLYRMAERLVRLTSELLAACNCEAGSLRAWARRAKWASGGRRRPCGSRGSYSLDREALRTGYRPVGGRDRHWSRCGARGNRGHHRLRRVHLKRGRRHAVESHGSRAQ